MSSRFFSNSISRACVFSNFNVDQFRAEPSPAGSNFQNLAIRVFCLEQNQGRIPWDSKMLIVRIIGASAAIDCPIGLSPSRPFL